MPKSSRRSGSLLTSAANPSNKRQRNSNSNNNVVEEKKQLADVMLTKGKLVYIDVRKIAIGNLIRDVRAQGLKLIEQSIRKYGYIETSIVTVSEAHSVAENETVRCIWERLSNDEKTSDEKEKLLLEKLKDNQRELVSGKWYIVVDGGHRCTSALNMYREGVLKHPYIPAIALSSAVNDTERQAIAATINEIAGDCIILSYIVLYLISFSNYKIVRYQSIGMLSLLSHPLC
jgi:hypothetical protein